MGNTNHANPQTFRQPPSMTVHQKFLIAMPTEDHTKRINDMAREQRMDRSISPKFDAVL